MIRVHVICEGQTEEMFVNEVLSSALQPKGIYLMPALLGKPGHKGGNVRIDRVLVDIRQRLLGDKTAYCTTLFDFYGLPEDFPGKNHAKREAAMAKKADYLLSALTELLRESIGEDAIRRFIPYIQMYEFEGLLFSHPSALACGIGHPEFTSALEEIRGEFNTPEDINDSAITAPSKRIQRLYSGYEKPIHGSLAALEMGLDVIRQECTRFNTWVERLESLLPQTPHSQ